MTRTGFQKPEVLFCRTKMVKKPELQAKTERFIVTCEETAV
jgi:hypothetical protein